MGAPVFIRICKREFELELWMRRDGRFERLVHRAHQLERAVATEDADERLVDPVRVALLERPVGERVE